MESERQSHYDESAVVPAYWEARWGRAMSERITLALDKQSFSESEIQIGVIGTRGVQYTIKMTKDDLTVCTCPDCRVNGFFCKHLILVLGKVFGIPKSLLLRFGSQTCDAYFTYAKQYQTKRAKELALAQSAREDLESHKRHKRRPLLQDSECAICTEVMADIKETDFCYVCGNSVHSSCFEKWNKPSCVYCRSEWHKL
jgi:hypothetical protein